MDIRNYKIIRTDFTVMGTSEHQDMEARISNDKFRLYFVLMPHNTEKCKLSSRDLRETRVSIKFEDSILLWRSRGQRPGRSP
jgi:hypothetical protein